jgi:hypothetical protein
MRLPAGADLALDWVEVQVPPLQGRALWLRDFPSKR